MWIKDPDPVFTRIRIRVTQKDRIRPDPDPDLQHCQVLCKLTTTETFKKKCIFTYAYCVGSMTLLKPAKTTSFLHGPADVPQRGIPVLGCARPVAPICLFPFPEPTTDLPQYPFSNPHVLYPVYKLSSLEYTNFVVIWSSADR